MAPEAGRSQPLSGCVSHGRVDKEHTFRFATLSTWPSMTDPGGAERPQRFQVRVAVVAVLPTLSTARTCTRIVLPYLLTLILKV